MQFVTDIERKRRAFRRWMSGLEDKPLVPSSMRTPDKRKQPDYREEQLKLW